MAKVNINLIPEELKITGPLLKTINLFKTMSIVGTVLFFIGVAVIVALMIMNNIRLGSLDKKSRSLESQIRGLATVEASYVQARLKSDFLSEIEKSPNARLNEFNDLLTSKMAGVDAANFDISDTSIEFQASSPSIKSVFSFFDNLMTEDIYKNIDIQTFSFKGGNFSMDVALKF